MQFCVWALVNKQYYLIAMRMCFYRDIVLKISNTLENIVAQILKMLNLNAKEIESIVEDLQSSKF